ncbi:hypothetical protein NHX12_029387 [Muraenolepis orangiensis]|uniref:Uncharacterized protein n=1 Tax=Muraenolepis orangiensis TaxID=630683 RepID=A0A9Q0IL48_9TELE|nr:hypothetical protein NHX12_029387 [Muraenolepis orangiensis]
MEYLGDKLSVAHSQVTGWVGHMRRSLQGALSDVRGEGDFKRTGSLRSLASRSRDSFRSFSLRSQQRLSLRRRTTAPNTPTSSTTSTVRRITNKHPPCERGSRG